MYANEIDKAFGDDRWARRDGIRDHVDRPMGRGVMVVMMLTVMMIMTPLSPAGRPARERPEGRVCAHGESTQPP